MTPKKMIVNILDIGEVSRSHEDWCLNVGNDEYELVSKQVGDSRNSS